MNVFIVYCHPEPTSFNAALVETTVRTFRNEGAFVEVSDLYGEGFDPVEKPEHYRNRIVPERGDILAEQRNAYKTETLPDEVARAIERLENCDLLILQFPLWWHHEPAMLKGWLDRVFVAGGLYTSKMRYDRGYFRGKQAMCSVTSGAPLETFTERGRAGGSIATLLHPLNFSLYYMGFEVFPPYLFTEVQGAGFTYKSPEEFTDHLRSHLTRWENYLLRFQETKPLDFPGWDDWDERGAER